MAEKPSAPLSGDLLASKGKASVEGFVFAETERAASRYRWRVAAFAATLSVSVGTIAFVGAALIYGGSITPGTGPPGGGEPPLPQSLSSAAPAAVSSSVPESLFADDAAEAEAVMAPGTAASPVAPVAQGIDSDPEAGKPSARATERRIAAMTNDGTTASPPPSRPPNAPAPRSKKIAAAEPPVPIPKPRNPTRRPHNLPRAAYRVQLHALASDTAVRHEWRRLRKKHRDLFAGLKLTVAPKRLGAGGKTVYRMQVGALDSRTKASALCRKLRRAKLDCMVVR